ncbi:Tim10/DDP family zinc finger containing protein [Diplonema papillatum]|nr:Tim10/DDP family zinc finger containing protein [Diplonema papillatum]
MPQFTKEMDREFEVLKRQQEDRLNLVATEKCFDVCVKQMLFPNLTRWEKECLSNCGEQWLQAAIACNKTFLRSM